MSSPSDNDGDTTEGVVEYTTEWDNYEGTPPIPGPTGIIAIPSVPAAVSQHKGKIYVVKAGRFLGAFLEWDPAQAATDRFEGAKHKSFKVARWAESVCYRWDLELQPDGTARSRVTRHVVPSSPQGTPAPATPSRTRTLFSPPAYSQASPSPSPSIVQLHTPAASRARSLPVSTPAISSPAISSAIIPTPAAIPTASRHITSNRGTRQSTQRAIRSSTINTHRIALPVTSISDDEDYVDASTGNDAAYDATDLYSVMLRHEREANSLAAQALRTANPHAHILPPIILSDTPFQPSNEVIRTAQSDLTRALQLARSTQQKADEWTARAARHRDGVDRLRILLQVEEASALRTAQEMGPIAAAAAEAADDAAQAVHNAQIQRVVEAIVKVGPRVKEYLEAHEHIHEWLGVAEVEAMLAAFEDDPGRLGTHLLGMELEESVVRYLLTLIARDRGLVPDPESE